MSDLMTRKRVSFDEHHYSLLKDLIGYARDHAALIRLGAAWKEGVRIETDALLVLLDRIDVVLDKGEIDG